MFVLTMNAATNLCGPLAGEFQDLPTSIGFRVTVLTNSSLFLHNNPHLDVGSSKLIKRTLASCTVAEYIFFHHLGNQVDTDINLCCRSWH